MHKSKNIVHINTKAKRSQTSCLQEVWPFYSLTSVKDGIITIEQKFVHIKFKEFCIYQNKRLTIVLNCVTINTNNCLHLSFSMIGKEGQIIWEMVVFLQNKVKFLNILRKKF